MNYKFSCVVDSKPIFKAQAYILVTSLLELLRVEPENIFVHIINKTDEEFYQWLESKKINIIEVEPFSENNPYCNKLQQLLTFEREHDFDYVFLLDCDTAILSLDGLELTEAVYAKPVDFPNPPATILKDIYDKAGVAYTPSASSFASKNDARTEFNNCNGGVYIISRAFINDLALKWKAYANWCIENVTLFTPQYSKHADQVAFGLAMGSLDQKLAHLSIEYNFPTHISKNLLPDIYPKIIHFHNEIDRCHSIKKKGLTSVDLGIGRLNEVLMNKNNRGNIINMNTTHTRDIGSDSLNRAFEEVKRPDLLRYLVDVSRTNLGFYTSHYPRVFEYSWLLEQLENQSGKKTLDIGAGVCPLPLCLSDMGVVVATVDSHSVIRSEHDKGNWNEWGFLDYSIINPKIQSTNIDFSKYNTKERYDSIYSISVIEHMPKKIRLGVLKKASNLLKKEGLLLLTIDLIPNTENLWNLSEDKEVEPIAVHGSLQTFKMELASLGFEIESEHIERNIYESRTDVYFVKAVLKKKKGWLSNLFT